MGREGRGERRERTGRDLGERERLNETETAPGPGGGLEGAERGEMDGSSWASYAGPWPSAVVSLGPQLRASHAPLDSKCMKQRRNRNK